MLKQKEPTLKRLSDSIPWESFLKTLEMGFIQERKSNAGRKGKCALQSDLSTSA